MEKVLCPYCGSDNIDVYDDDQFMGEYVEECYCLDCDKNFDVIYEMKLKEIRKAE